MKILYVGHSFPYPISEGLRLRVYHLLKHLSKKNEIHLLCYIYTPDEKKNLHFIQPFCKSITTINHEIPIKPWTRIFSILFRKDPFCLSQYYTEEMKSALQDKISKISPDLVHIDHSPMGQYGKFVPPNYPKVFLSHDALSLLFKTSYIYERHPLRKYYFWNQYKKLRRYEKNIVPLFDKTVVVSPVDKEILLEGCPAASVDWSPNGVDCDYFHDSFPPEKKNVLLFRGIMNFFPNHDSAMYFAKSVMPLIWRDKKDVEFWVVGHAPLASLRKLAQKDSRIKLFGFVPDIREPMAQATIVVCPIRSGSGIKNKILESLAMAKGVVGTPSSLAGIDAVNEKHLLVGDTPKELAKQTLRLLNDPFLRRRLGQEGRNFVKIHHSWAAHAEFFNVIYSQARKKKANLVMSHASD